MFFEGMSEKKKNSRSFWLSFLEFIVSVIFCISNAFYDVQNDIQANENVTNSYIYYFPKRNISNFILKCKFSTNPNQIAAAKLYTYIDFMFSFQGRSNLYVGNFFPKSNISNTLIRTCTRTSAYQGAKNVSFSKNFAYVLIG